MRAIPLLNVYNVQCRALRKHVYKTVPWSDANVYFSCEAETKDGPIRFDLSVTYHNGERLEIDLKSVEKYNVDPNTRPRVILYIPRFNFTFEIKTLKHKKTLQVENVLAKSRKVILRRKLHQTDSSFNHHVLSTTNSRQDPFHKTSPAIKPTLKTSTPMNQRGIFCKLPKNKDLGFTPYISSKKRISRIDPIKQNSADIIIEEFVFKTFNKKKNNTDSKPHKTTPAENESSKASFIDVGASKNNGNGSVNQVTKIDERRKQNNLQAKDLNADISRSAELITKTNLAGVVDDNHSRPASNSSTKHLIKRKIPNIFENTSRIKRREVFKRSEFESVDIELDKESSAVKEDMIHDVEWSDSHRPSSLQNKLSLGGGFENIGNTCFMNSVLQSFFGLECFRKDLFNFYSIRSHLVPSDSFFRCLVELQSKKYLLADKKRKLLENVKSAISRVAPQFEGYRQHDAHEFVRVALSLLKQEVADVFGKENHLGYAGPALQQECPVSTNFGFKVQQSYKCLRCSLPFTVVEDWYDIAVDISASQSDNHATKPSIQKLLDKSLKEEDIEHSCRSCRSNLSQKHTHIVELPRVLTIYVMRYALDTSGTVKKMHQRIEIDKQISLTKHHLLRSDLDINNNHIAEDTTIRYDLTCIVNHLGETPTSGHYINDVLQDKISRLWRCYNDTIVTDTYGDDILKRRELHAYILFYVKV